MTPGLLPHLKGGYSEGCFPGCHLAFICLWVSSGLLRSPLCFPWMFHFLGPPALLPAHSSNLGVSSFQCLSIDTVSDALLKRCYLHASSSSPHCYSNNTTERITLLASFCLLPSIPKSLVLTLA